MMNTKCTRYKVDPQLLNEGIPVECLEKKDEQILGEPKQLNSYVQGAILHRSKGKELPKLPDRLEIELTLTDYSKVKAGYPINISPEIALHDGEKFKLLNRGTTMYLMRSLTVSINEKGDLQGNFRKE